MKSPKGFKHVWGILRRGVLLVAILWLLIDLRVRLWRHPYSQVRAHADVLARRGPRFRAVGPQWIIRWIGRLGVVVPHCTCLVRALAAQILLRRRGVEVEIVFGARFTEAKKFEAHAWVEYRGQVLLGDMPDLKSHRVLRREVIGGG